MHIAVIGAGMAGLTCASALRAAGLSPVVFEKSRGIGGRLATRRVDDMRFDHGAQVITATGSAFRDYLTKHAKLWKFEGAEDEFFVGAPAMNALVKPMADGLDIRLDEKVSPKQIGGSWHIGTEAFDRMISTIPVVQARMLFPEMVDELANVDVEPRWTLMVAFETETDWPNVINDPDGALIWIARNSAKPEREALPESWVVHASPLWSATHLEIDRNVAQEHMLDLLRGARGILPKIRYVAAHRWRYAVTARPLGRSFAEAADGSLLIGGDWCLGRKVENAYDSGMAMAAAILA